MTRRFPPAIPGLPNSQKRYRVILQALDFHDIPPTKDEFIPICQEAIEVADPEDDSTLSESWTKHILSDMIRSGFIDEFEIGDSSRLDVSRDSAEWLRGELEFDDFVLYALRRSWVLDKQFPEGFEALERILHAVTYSDHIDQPTSSREIRSTLEEDYDYKFSRQGIRGYIPLLEHMGMLADTEEGIIVPESVDPDNELEKLRRFNIFQQLERWLRREGAMVEPPSNEAK